MPAGAEASSMSEPPAPDASDDVPAEDPLEAGAAEVQVFGLDSEAADAVLDAVASEAARTVLAALHDEPATASAVAARTDLSLGTVQYHLDSLTAAGLLEVVDTAVSEKGREMDVYGPTRRPVVVLAGDRPTDLRAALSRLLSGVGLLALASLLVQEVLGGGVDALLGRPGGAGAAVTGAAPGAVPPGVAFFAGGLAVLLVGTAAWYLRRHGSRRTAGGGA